MITELLGKVAFVDKVVFGKWNYNSLATAYDRRHSFYSTIVPQVVEWCGHNDKSLHIKAGTPLASASSREFLRIDVGQGERACAVGHRSCQ